MRDTGSEMDHDCGGPDCQICVMRQRIAAGLRSLDGMPDVEWENTAGGLAVFLPAAAMRLAALRRKWMDGGASEGHDLADQAADMLTSVMVLIHAVAQAGHDHDEGHDQ